MAAVPAAFLGVIRGVPVYGGDVIEAQTNAAGGMIPARLVDIERGSDGLPRFVVESVRGNQTEVPLEHVGAVLFSGRNPALQAASTTIGSFASFKDAVAEMSWETMVATVSSRPPKINGKFDGTIPFGGLKIRMDETVVFKTGSEIKTGVVSGYRSLGHLLLVTAMMGNYAVAADEFLGVLQPARKD